MQFDFGGLQKQQKAEDDQNNSVSAVEIEEFDDEDGILTERGNKNGFDSSTVLGKIDKKSNE